MRGSLTATRLLTLFLFLLLIAICAYWVLQIVAPRPAIAPSASIGDNNAATNLTPAIALFGSSSAVAAGTPSAPSNIQVSGVAESGPNGVVILSIDGKPGVAYAVDESVIDGTTVKSVALDKVVLDQRGRLVELKTPDRASQEVLSSGAGKPRTASEASTAAPVPTRTATPPPQPARVPPPQMQSPQPPQQQQLQQVQQQQQQQAQPAPPQGQPLPNPQAGVPQGGSQPMQGDAQPGAGDSTAVSGQPQVAPGQQSIPGQPGSR